VTPHSEKKSGDSIKIVSWKMIKNERKNNQCDREVRNEEMSFRWQNKATLIRGGRRFSRILERLIRFRVLAVPQVVVT
jgi:hypothetical protein